MKKCPTDVPKVDPRIQRTHKMLEEAFRSLLAEGHGCDLSVSDLTGRATVNRATFYAHFEDIHQFATTILLADLDAALFARLPPGTLLCASSLVEVGIAIYEFVNGFSRSSKVKNGHGSVMGAALQEKVQQRLQEFFSTWLNLDPNALYAFPGAARETVATTLAWSLYGGALSWSRLTSDKRPPAPEAARQIIALFFR